MALETKPNDEIVAEEAEKEMCCDGSGRTADEHRAESADGKCCVDG
jgi:hypothetical protein